jgi:hypothetical protein
MTRACNIPTTNAYISCICSSKEPVYGGLVVPTDGLSSGCYEPRSLAKESRTSGLCLRDLDEGVYHWPGFLT